jgi:hypothetical protein
MLFHARNGAGEPRKGTDQPRGTPPKCFTAAISTVEPGADWGAYEFNGFRYVADQRNRHRDRAWYNVCSRRAENSVVFEHRVQGHWLVVFGGSEGHIPVPARILSSLNRGLQANDGIKAPPGSKVAATSAAPECRDSSLAIRFGGPPDGSAGTTYYKLRFTNRSDHSCTLQGSPGVTVVSAAGKRIGSATKPDARGPAVTVRPHHTVHAPLGFVEIGNFPKADCRPRRAAGLRVIAPNTSQARFVKASGPQCSHTRSVIVQDVQR